MKINDVRSANNIYPSIKKDAKTTEATKSNYDTIEIGKAKYKAAPQDTGVYAAMAQKASKAVLSATDPQKLEVIKQQVQNGTYRVSTEAIADAMLSNKTKG